MKALCIFILLLPVSLSLLYTAATNKPAGIQVYQKQPDTLRTAAITSQPLIRSTDCAVRY